LNQRLATTRQTDQQRLIGSPKKTKQRIARRQTSLTSAQSFQGGLHPILQLQRMLGNRWVAQLIQAKRLTPEGMNIGFQRKLTVGAADDQHEQEADRVARLVISMPNAVASKLVQRQPETEEEEAEPIQTKSVGSLADSFDAGADVETQVSLSKGRGSPLPDPVRVYMEPRFGVDFSHVHVHTGSDALQMNQAVGAQAFTHGSDIYFGAGHSPTDLELTAHELTHVVQQTGGVPLQTKKREEEVAPPGPEPSIQWLQRQGDPAPAAAHTDADPLPSESELTQAGMTWAHEVWGALNQGLADFEHNAQIADWTTFALNVLGNLVWATAAFSTGGMAFLISIEGIAVSTVASAGAVNSVGEFHSQARADSDALLKAIQKRAPEVAKHIHELGAHRGWKGKHAYRVLMGTLLKPEFFTQPSGFPTIDSARIAATTEYELFVHAGASPSKDWAGWQHGDWWIEYEYRADGAMAPPREVYPISQWRLSQEHGSTAKLFPIDPAVHKSRDRLNEIQKSRGGGHRVRDWPLRKTLKLYVRGSRALVVQLDGKNRIQGAGGEYLDREEIERLRQAAGWEDLGRGLTNWVWSASGGLPPDIDKIE